MYQSSSRVFVVEPGEPEKSLRRQPERRKASAAPDTAGLTAEQLSTLQTMEQFHWRLQFVRRPLFRAPIPVLLDRGETRHVVIEEDGTIDENPSLRLRG